MLGFTVSEMHLKSDSQGEIQNKMDFKGIRCPICTELLKKEESFHDHLNTHPKEQVIEALIQLKDAFKDTSPSSSSFERTNTAANESSCSSREVFTPNKPNKGDSVGAVEESTLVVPSLNQQILPPPAPMAHVIHVPVVTSTAPYSVTPAVTQVCIHVVCNCIWCLISYLFS